MCAVRVSVCVCERCATMRRARYSLRDERSSSLIDIYGQMQYVLHRQSAT